VRTLSTIAAAVVCLVLVCAAALALRAGSMKPADVREQWEEFAEKTIRPIRENGLMQPWEATTEERFDEEGFLREAVKSPK
jgi:hypothetical protein